jgi:histone demethylase JARID1
MKQLPSKMQPLAPKKHLAEQNEICVICSKNGSMNEIIICDDCKRPWHLFCLIPELTIIPDSEWFCKNCIEIHGDSYGFEERKELRKLGDFTRFGDEFKYNWFMNKSERK